MRTTKEKQFTPTTKRLPGSPDPLRLIVLMSALVGGLGAMWLLWWSPAPRETAGPPEVAPGFEDHESSGPMAGDAAAPADTTVTTLSLPARQDLLWETPATEPPFAAFQQWVEEFNALPEAEQPAAVARGVALAQVRREALKTLIPADPEQALALAVPMVVRRGLPPEITVLLEQRVDARGDLDAIGVAPGEAGGGGPAVLRCAEVHGQRYRAYVFGMREFQPARKDIALHGIALDRVMAVDQWPGRVLEPIEVEEARSALPAEPICETSGQPTASTGQEVALNLGGGVEFFCGPGHANGVLNEAALRDALVPPGLGNRSTPEITAASGEKGVTVPSFTSMGDAEWTTGGKRIAVVRVSFDGTNYTDLQSGDCAEIVDQMSDQLRRWSYGKYWLRPVGSGGSSVSTVFDLPSRASSYDDGDISEIWLQTALWFRTRYPALDYDLLMVLAGDAPIQDEDKGGTVWWGGLGRIGGGLTFIRVNEANLSDRIARNASVGLHELGHNLGLFHASNLFPTPQIIGGFINTSLEYGDRFDRMGRGGAGDDFNVRFKQWLRWLSPAEVPSAVSNGRYAIRPHDLGESFGVRGLKVPFGSQGLFNDSLYVEYRAGQPENPLLQQGVTIRLGKQGSPKTYLMDATPATPNHEPEGNDSGNLDSPLLPGRTYSHTLNGRTVHITNVETRPGEAAWVEVVQGTPAGNGAPTGSLTANASTLEYGQTSYLTANVTDPDGDELAYYWTIADLGSLEEVGPYPNQRTLPFKFFKNGSRQVTCVVSDMRGGVRTLTQSFTVATNNPPTISAISNQSTNEDTPLTTATFTVSDVTLPGAMIQVSATSDNTALLPNANIQVNHLGGGSRSLTLTPVTNRHGQATITVNASDGAKVSQRKFVFTVRPVTPGVVYVTRGGTWRYRDSVTAPPADWAAADFNDATWSTGTARFVMNQGVPLPGQTQLRQETNRITTYYRRALTLPAGRTGTPTLKLLCDDGAVVYVNGVEVWRQNLPDGPVSHTRRALIAVEGLAESMFSIIPLPAAALQTGTNIIAVSVHDAANSREGFDVAFDAELAFIQAPTLTGPSALSTPEDTPRIANISAAESESPSGGIVLSASSADPTLVADTGVTFGFNLLTSQRTVTITPMPDAHGTTTITLKASDGSSETWLPVQFTVTPVNDAPTIAPLPPVAVASGEVPPLVLVELDDLDSPLASLTLTVASSSPNVPSGGLEVMPGPTAGQRWLRVTPNPAVTSGQSTLTLTASDGQLNATTSFVFRVTSPIAPDAQPVPLVRGGESWRYYAGNLPLDDRGRPPDWANPDLDDRNWPQGKSPLGYGYSNLGTTVPVSPYRVTTYFRHSFYLDSTDGISHLVLRLRRDDGAAVYLNNELIAQQNLPRSFTESTLASSTVGQAVWENLISEESSALRPGWNVVAVEVHQSTMPSSFDQGDLIMDLELDAVVAPPVAVDSLITANDQWDYWDTSPYPDATWKTPVFAPDGWKTGLARLGFGIGGEATVVGGGPSNNRHPSILFRRAFDIGDPAVYRSLHLFLLADDGAQVFLNGSRVIYQNVAPAAHEGSFALTEVPSGEHFVWRQYVLDPKRLQPGRNLLAVSLHQSSQTNADLAFDLQLTAGLHDAPPRLFLRWQPHGQELSWPAAFNDWRLETSSSLQPDSWTPVNEPVLRDGPWHYVQHPGSDPARFFRLRKPR